MKVLTRKEEQVLLAVFSLQDNAYLITIREQIKKFTGTYYSVGTIFAPLNRLHINEYLDSRLEKLGGSNSNKPVRYYRLAEKGVKALTELKTQTDRMWSSFSDPAIDSRGIK